MYSEKYNCIFVHIPRTGGTSIEEVIWPIMENRTEAELWMGFVDPYHNKYQTGGLQHLLAMQIRQEIGEAVFNRCYRFTVVRNPWDKAVSQYSLMKYRKGLRDFIGMQENDDFKTYLSLIQRREHVQWMPQFRFFLDENGEQLVNFIARFENFNDDVSTILGELDIKVDAIPHSAVNKTVRGNYRQYYDDESVEMIRQIYRQDIELLGYEF